MTYITTRAKSVKYCAVVYTWMRVGRVSSRVCMLALPRLSSPGIEPRRTDGALGANLPYLHNSTAVTAKPPGSTLLELVEVDSGMAHCGEVDLVHVVHQHCPAADVVRNFEMRAAETSVGHLYGPVNTAVQPS